MPLFGKRPRGKLLGTAASGLAIHELVHVRQLMRGGGWCSAAFGAGAPFPLVEPDALDVPWKVARDGLLDMLTLHAEVFDAEAVAVRGVAADLAALQPNTSLDRIVRADEPLHYWLIPTAEAYARGAGIELLVQAGRSAWIERALVPNPL